MLEISVSAGSCLRNPPPKVPHIRLHIKSPSKDPRFGNQALIFGSSRLKILELRVRDCRKET